jgi:hypothetical protein
MDWVYLANAVLWKWCDLPVDRTISLFTFYLTKQQQTISG